MDEESQKEMEEQLRLEQEYERERQIEEGLDWERSWALKEEEPKDENTVELPVYTLAELLELKFEKPNYFIEPVIPQTGITLVAGASGSLKTAVISDLFISIVKGRKWLNHYELTGKCDRILYLDGEVGPQVIQSRLKSMGAPATDRVDYLYRQWRIEDNLEYETLMALVTQGNYDLIIIDSLSAMHNMEERNDTVVFLMQRLRSLGDAANCPIVLLANFNKTKAERQELLERITGPAYYRNKSSAIVTLRRFGGKGKYKARFQVGKNWMGGEGETRTLELAKHGEYLEFRSEAWTPPSEEDEGSEDDDSPRIVERSGPITVARTQLTVFLATWPAGSSRPRRDVVSDIVGNVGRGRKSPTTKEAADEAITEAISGGFLIEELLKAGKGRPLSLLRKPE